MSGKQGLVEWTGRWLIMVFIHGLGTEALGANANQSPMYPKATLFESIL